VNAADIATVVALVVAGPWGLVIIVALVRGYDLRVLITKRRMEKRGDEDDPE
jgi:hypothetical protein